jgi:hypothetical protein
MNSKKVFRFLMVQCTFLLILCLTGAAMAQAPSFRPVATVLQIMQGMVVPNSDVIFKISHNPPKDDKEWTVVQNSAITLAEVGNLLMIPGRTSVYKDLIDTDIKRNGDWAKNAKALTELSTRAFHAANAKDIKELEAMSNELEATCEHCHATYHPLRGSEPLP